MEKKYTTYKDLITESTLLSFTNFEYDPKVSSFNITVGESYAVKTKKDRQTGKYEFELTDKYGNMTSYSEKKFISLYPEAYVKFKDEIHDNAAKYDPDLKNLDKKLIKEEVEETSNDIDFMFKAVNPIGTDINSMFEVDFIIPYTLDNSSDYSKLFHILLALRPNQNEDPYLLIKAYVYTVDDDYQLGTGIDSKTVLEEQLKSAEFKEKYPNLLKMLNTVIIDNGLYSFVSKYGNDNISSELPLYSTEYIEK